MRPVSTKTNLQRVALVAALVLAGIAAPLATHYLHRDRAPTPPVVVPPPAHGTDTPVAAAPPPGTEVVPEEESDADHEPLLSPSRPTESFGRTMGLHRKPDPLHLNASAAVVLDHGTGEVLAQKNAQVQLPIASLTKLMTTLLVIGAKQPMDEVLTITQDDVDTLRHSRSRLRPGTKLTREEALHLALMSSENRAAHALARYYPGGVPKLVEDMNAKAKALGMKDTTYADPTGLSNANRSTARDLAILVGTAAQVPLMRDFTTTHQHLANLGGRVLQYNNSNRLVKNPRWDIELQKTGYIVEAGRCMTMLTRVADHELVMVLLDSDSNGTRMADAERLRRWVVAEEGWQDRPVLAASAQAPAKHARTAGAKNHAKSSRHQAVAKSTKGSGKRRSTAVAARKKATKQAAAAKSKKQAVAAKGSGHRVRQSFAAGKSGTHG